MIVREWFMRVWVAVALAMAAAERGLDERRAQVEDDAADDAIARSVAMPTATVASVDYMSEGLAAEAREEYALAAGAIHFVDRA